MSTKLVIGLTDETTELFFPDSSILSQPMPEVLTSRDAYNLAENDVSVEKATLEWELNTSLPAVNALLETIVALKQRPYFSKIRLETRASVSADYQDIDVSFELLNMVPNLAVSYQPYTTQDNEAVITTLQSFGSLELEGTEGYRYQGIDISQIMSSAYEADDLSLLYPGPVNRLVVPVFNFSFFLGRTQPPSTQMSADQYKWMSDNQSALSAKGYEIDDPRSKIGALPIGVLLGDPMEQYEKIKQFRKICRIDIVSE
jgi:hypothetical protein